MGLLHTGNYKAVLLGDDLTDGDVLAYLSTIREIPSFPEVIVVSRSRDPDTAEAAIQTGMELRHQAAEHAAASGAPQTGHGIS